MKQVKFRIEGVMPLMLNNPQTVNPFNEYSKMLKPLTSKRTKTDDDLEEISKIKFLSSVYRDKQGNYILPSEHFENAIIGAAKERKLGKKFERSMQIVGDAILQFTDADKTPEELYNLGIYVDVRAVGIKNVKITTTRAIIPEWRTEISVWYDESQIDEKDLTDCMEIAGMRYGVGTYRRKFGRFTAKKVK